MDFPADVRVVENVAAAFAEVVVATRPQSVALSGGATARQCYEALRDSAPDWPSTAVFFGDERWVPIDDPDSNEGMARRVLLEHGHPRAVHSMRTAGNDPEHAAKNYDALLRATDPVELVHLGLGPDGHTASLFPESPALAERDRLVVATGDARHPHPRLTWTFPAIARSRLVVFTVAGTEKREAFARVRAGNDLPAARVRAERVLWLVDRAAADEE